MFEWRTPMAKSKAILIVLTLVMLSSCSEVGYIPLCSEEPPVRVGEEVCIPFPWGFWNASFWN